MGQSVIWYLPAGASVMQRIEFPLKITGRIGPRPVYRQTVNETVSGAQTTVLYSGRSEVTIQHTFTRGTLGSVLRRELMTLQAHLAAGGTCVFVEDEALAFAGFIVTGRDVDTDEFSVEVNLFSEIAEGTPDCSGAELVVNTDTDRYLYEEHECDVHIDDGLSMTEGLRQNMSSARWAMVRERGSWPALRVPAELRDSLDIVPHDRDWVFRFSLPLEEDPQTLNALEASGLPLLGVEASAMFPGDFDPDLGVSLIKGESYGWD